MSLLGVYTPDAVLQYCGWGVANFINADKSIKGMQVGDNEIKIVKPSS